MSRTTSTPTLQDLTTAVSEMRQAQLSYFRTRDQEVLIVSKRLERKVDGMLVELQRMPLFRGAPGEGPSR